MPPPTTVIRNSWAAGIARRLRLKSCSRLSVRRRKFLDLQCEYLNNHLMSVVSWICGVILPDRDGRGIPAVTISARVGV